jgi:hypothetical protein
MIPEPVCEEPAISISLYWTFTPGRTWQACHARTRLLRR